LPSFACAGPRPPHDRRKLAAPQEVQGYLCARGWAWFYSDGHLDSCTLERDTPFGEVQAPKGSWIRLTAKGKPLYLVLSHDLQIFGYHCRGGGLGGAEGPTTAFYPSGKIRLIWLAGDQMVQGVPCLGGGFFSDFFTGGADASFYESGKLRTCKLSHDFAGLRKGQRIFQAP
jgi:hypothetical protein